MAIEKYAAQSDVKISKVKSLLDSLGFFKASCDTVHDTITIRPGKRSIVESVAILSGLRCSIDSIQTGLFPRPYDAGELQALANKTLYFFGSRGYPFARLFIDISDSTAGGRPQNGPAARGLAVTFTVSENGLYAFAKPLLTGKTRTSARLLGRDISIKKGTVFDLRKIEESKNRLLSRPYITAVKTGPLKMLKEDETASRVHDTATGPDFSGNVTVPFIISDNTGLGVDGAVAFQAGAASTRPTGIFNISLLNLFHYGETGMLAYRGEQGYQRLEVSLAVPYLFGVALFGSAGFGLEIQQENYGYLHGEVKLTTDLWPWWQWGLVLNGHEVTTYNKDSVAVNRQFAGIDFVVSRETQPYRAGQWRKEAEFKIGSGIAQSPAVQLTRWHLEAAGGVQYPLNFRHAIVGRTVFGTLLADASDTLQTVELYRTGGYKSIRGYMDNEFAFSTVVYGQLEYHYYFNYFGSAYIFTDGGAGLFDKNGAVPSHALQKMLGYGIGIRIPVKIGDASIEWARNYKDSRSWGRIHVSIRNAVSAGLPHS